MMMMISFFEAVCVIVYLFLQMSNFSDLSPLASTKLSNLGHHWDSSHILLFPCVMEIR